MSSERAIPPKRAIERVLRHTGLSRRQAKQLIARGYREPDTLDADTIEAVVRLAASLRPAARDDKGAA